MFKLSVSDFVPSISLWTMVFDFAQDPEPFG